MRRDDDERTRAAAAARADAVRPRHRGARRSSRPRRIPATRRSCCPTARSRASSAVSARRTRCARPHWARCRRARACCCGCCPTATCTSRRRRARASWSTRACPAARWRSSWCPQVPAPLVRIFGATPIADALVEMCAALGYDVRSGDAGRPGRHDRGGDRQPRRTRGRDDPRRPGRGRRLHRAGGQPGSRRRDPGRARAHRSRAAPACTRRSGCRSARRRPPRSRCRSSPR